MSPGAWRESTSLKRVGEINPSCSTLISPTMFGQKCPIDIDIQPVLVRSVNVHPVFIFPTLEPIGPCFLESGLSFWKQSPAKRAVCSCQRLHPILGGLGESGQHSKSGETEKVEVTSESRGLERVHNSQENYKASGLGEPHLEVRSWPMQRGAVTKAE